MTLIRWNPRSLSSIFDDDFEFPTLPGISRLGQGLNIYETEDALVAEAALPGIPEDKIDVTVEDGIARISAQSSDNQEQKDQRRYFMSSLVSSYNYSFRLPEGVIKDEEPSAEVENGVLTLVFPKLEKVPPRKIKVVKKGK